jgi:cytochrome P450
MAAEVLSHALRGGGWPGPQYDHGGICPVRVAGSREGAAELYLLRSWDSVVTVLRQPGLRDLRNIPRGHAVGGVTLQHQDGLLRRNPPDTNIGRVFKPLFADVAHWRPAIREFARRRAAEVRAARGPVDLGAVFCRPFIGDVVTLTAGLLDGEWPVLRDLSNRTTGALLRSPGDHAVVTGSWDDMYEFCRPVIARKRAAWQRAGHRTGMSLTTRTVAAMDASGMPGPEVDHAAPTVFNGFPTTEPTFLVAVAEMLLHPDAIELCRERPGLWRAALREILRLKAHFTFALPGLLTQELTIDGCTLPRGSAVLPVVHAAEYDTTRTPDPGAFDLMRPPRPILAFGAGPHRCPGMALVEMAMAEGLAALTELNRGLRLAVRPEQVPWLEGTMPAPAEIPAVAGPG